MQILAITTARNACIDRDLSTAEELLTQDILVDANTIFHMHIAHLSWRENMTGITPFRMQLR